MSFPVYFPVGCGAGTYYNLDRDRCIQCSAGTYQNEAAQFLCKPCPHGTASVEPGAMNVSQCIGIVYISLHRAVKLGRIFPGTLLKVNGAPGNIQGNLDRSGYFIVNRNNKNEGFGSS